MQPQTLSALAERYLKIRNYTEEICSPLGIEDYILQPIIDVSPPKWHIGHTTWFFEEFILKKYSPGYRVYNEKFNFIFNSYYESLGKRVDRSKRGFISRPGVEEIFEYRKYVNNHIVDLLEAQGNSDKLNELITLGLNHEQQHQELLWTDIKYILGTQPYYPAYSEIPVLNETGTCRTDYVSFPSGEYGIGYQGSEFHFDNEREFHLVKLEEFEIRKGLVSNAEYIEFIENNGYGDFRFWHSEGWSWIQENNIHAPLYWIKKDNKWYNYTLQGLLEIDPSAPLCHINYYEAYAFANFRGERLATEFEREIAHEEIETGDRWEWTNSAYLPYPGYRQAPGAIGEYNGKFMVSQMVLRGPSVATPPGHSRKTYRNFWHPVYQWQFTGIRLAKVLK